MEEINEKYVVCVVSEDNMSTIGDHQSYFAAADDSQNVNNALQVDGACLVTTENDVTQDYLLEVVHDSQKQVEVLTSEVEEKDTELRVLAQQLIETQQLLYNTSVERDDLKSKNTTYSTVIKESLQKICAAKTDQHSSDPTQPQAEVDLLNASTLEEVEVELGQSILESCTKLINTGKVKTPQKRQYKKKNKLPPKPTTMPGLRFLIPRPDESDCVMDVRIAGCSTDGSEAARDTMVKMGVGSIIDGINEPLAKEYEDKRVATIYLVIEGLKEFMTEHTYPYGNCSQPVCGLPLATVNEVESHYRDFHDMGTILSIKPKTKRLCIECDRIFLNANDLKLHHKLHHPMEVDEELRQAMLKTLAAVDVHGLPLPPSEKPKKPPLQIIVLPQPTLPPDIVRKMEMNPIEVPRKFQCHYCKSKYAIKDFCEAHIREKHFQIARAYHCNTCGRNLMTRKAYRSHLEVHQRLRKDSNHVCDICGRNFVSAQNLRRHQNLHTNERSHLCSICGSTFMQKGSLDNHMRTHGYGDQLQCPFCCRGYKVASKLKEHIESRHRENPKYECCVCFSRVKDAESLKLHFELHKTIDREKPFGCHMCTFSTYFTRDLMNHINAHARGVARLDKRRHGQSSGQSTGPFVCKYCGKKCNGKDYLDLHEVKHTGVKKYNCEECGRHFTMRPLLRRHIESRHQGVKYPCKICGKEFTEPGNIKRHIADVHNKAKPFSCALCERVFAQKASLRIHLNTSSHRERLCKLANVQTKLEIDEADMSGSVIEQLVFTDGINHMVIHHPDA